MMLEDLKPLKVDISRVPLDLKIKLLEGMGFDIFEFQDYKREISEAGREYRGARMRYLSGVN